MRRFSRASRSESWSAMSIDSAPLAAVRATSPSLSMRSTHTSQSLRNKDTGFPEPFCGTGNTTWRHPDANTSPDFYISSDDIDASRTYMRSRRTFLNRNRRTTVNHGKIPETSSLPASRSLADVPSHDVYGDLDSIVEAAPPSRGNTSSGGSFDSTGSDLLSRTSRDMVHESAGPASHTQSTELEQKPTTATLDRPTTSSSSRGGLFRKLRRHD